MTPDVRQAEAEPGGSLLRKIVSTWKQLGPGLISGAANDDPTAIGTYAQAGARLGPSILWAAPVTLPITITVVFLCSKIGIVSDTGLGGVIRQHYPKWLLYAVAAGLMFANVVEASADIGALAAALNLFIPIPPAWLIPPIDASLLVFQLWSSYASIRNVFKWLSLTLFAYVIAAIFAKPAITSVLWGTFVPNLGSGTGAFTFLIAVAGTTLSPYLYVWQASEAVEEKHQPENRTRPRAQLLSKAWSDVAIGMFFSTFIMYFVILCTAATLFKSGGTQVSSASEVARALQPFAGKAAGVLFALGIIGVGVLAVPVLTTGVADMIAEAARWRHGLNEPPRRARKFYSVIAGCTVLAMVLNYVGINLMKALLWAGVVNGVLAGPLMLIIMLITNNRAIMGERVNSRSLNLAGWITTDALFAALTGAIVKIFIP